MDKKLFEELLKSIQEMDEIVSDKDLPVWRDRCTYWRKYMAKREPTCGCRKCWDKWNNAIRSSNKL